MYAKALKKKLLVNRTVLPFLLENYKNSVNPLVKPMQNTVHEIENRT